MSRRIFDRRIFALARAQTLRASRLSSAVSDAELVAEREEREARAEYAAGLTQGARGRRPLARPPEPPQVVVLYVSFQMEHLLGSVEEVLRTLLCATLSGWDWERLTDPDSIASALAVARSRQGFIPYPTGRVDGNVSSSGGLVPCGTVVPIRFRRLSAG